jgi:predicted nucleotidyltransferase
LLNEKKVRYLIVGGYAVAFHGFVRATGDMDIFVENSEKNAAKLVSAYNDFGFKSPEIRKELFMERGKIIRIGVPPLRLEVMNEISGITFEQAYPHRIEEKIGSVKIPFTDLEHLLKNKKAAGRPKDLADIEELTGMKKTLAIHNVHAKS